MYVWHSEHTDFVLGDSEKERDREKNSEYSENSDFPESFLKQACKDGEKPDQYSAIYGAQAESFISNIRVFLIIFSWDSCQRPDIMFCIYLYLL